MFVGCGKIHVVFFGALFRMLAFHALFVGRFAAPGARLGGSAELARARFGAPRGGGRCSQQRSRVRHASAAWLPQRSIERFSKRIIEQTLFYHVLGYSSAV